MTLRFKVNVIYIIVLILFSNCNKNYARILKDDKVYLFFRESESKLGYISQSYNINNINYSHVGIGILKNNALRIIHILPNNFKDKNDLKIDSYNDFFNPQKDNIIHGTILEIRKSNKKHYKEFEVLLNSYRNKKLSFDKKFNEFDEKYYCSELVCKLLEDLTLFKCEKTKVKLKRLDKQFLQRDSLSYYPVDLYFGENNFKEVLELKF